MWHHDISYIYEVGGLLFNDASVQASIMIDRLSYDNDIYYFLIHWIRPVGPTVYETTVTSKKTYWYETIS